MKAKKIAKEQYFYKYFEADVLAIVIKHIETFTESELAYGRLLFEYEQPQLLKSFILAPRVSSDPNVVSKKDIMHASAYYLQQQHNVEQETISSLCWLDRSTMYREREELKQKGKVVSDLAFESLMLEITPLLQMDLENPLPSPKFKHQKTKWLSPAMQKALDLKKTKDAVQKMTLQEQMVYRYLPEDQKKSFLKLTPQLRRKKALKKSLCIAQTLPSNQKKFVLINGQFIPLKKLIQYLEKAIRLNYQYKRHYRLKVKPKFVAQKFSKKLDAKLAIDLINSMNLRLLPKTPAPVPLQMKIKKKPEPEIKPKKNLENNPFYIPPKPELRR